MAKLDVKITEVLGNSAKIFSTKFVHKLLTKHFSLCAMLPLIFKIYGEVFHVHVFVDLMVLNVYAF